MDLRLNAETIAAIQRQRQMGFGWRYDGLGAWTTEAIFAKLQELDVDTDPERFADQAKKSGRCAALHKSWTQGKERYDLWDDFPFLAAEELWQRLTPDLLCPEILCRYLDKVVRPPEKGDQNRGGSEKLPILQVVLPLLDYLEFFPEHERAQRYQEICACTIYDYREVLQNAVISEGRKQPDDATRLADVLSQADPDSAASYLGDLPYALAQAGRREQALERIQANLARFPDNVWIRMYAGDVYRDLGENADALEYYLSAMKATTDPTHWDVFHDQAMRVLQKQGRTEEGEDLQRLAPRPAERTVRTRTYSPPAPAPSRAIAPTPIISQVPFPKGPKVGANDPCPCGSGKKYKKCCKR